MAAKCNPWIRSPGVARAAVVRQSESQSNMLHTVHESKCCDPNCSTFRQGVSGGSGLDELFEMGKTHRISAGKNIASVPSLNFAHNDPRHVFIYTVAMFKSRIKIGTSAAAVNVQSGEEPLTFCAWSSGSDMLFCSFSIPFVDQASKMAMLVCALALTLPGPVCALVDHFPRKPAVDPSMAGLAIPTQVPSPTEG